MWTNVDYNNLWSILNHSTANKDISLTRGPIFLDSALIFMHLQLLLPLTSSSIITSERWWAWWKSRMKTSASYPKTRTWDVFINLAARASQNTSQVLVHVDDAGVLLVFLHHAHHLCKVVLKQIGQRVSAISMYMTTLGQKGEGRPFQLSEADHLDAFAHLSETELFQGSVCCKWEQLTCLLYSCMEKIVNYACLQTLLSKMPKKGPKWHNTWTRLFQPSYHHHRLWWINSSNESISWLIYGSVPILTSHAGNQFGTDGNLSCCGWLWSNATGSVLWRGWIS